MNKFVASALFACLVAVATAANIPNAYNPNNEMETAQLGDDQSEFSDFCIKERDFVLADIKSKDETTAADLLTILETKSLVEAPSFLKSAQESGDYTGALGSLKGICEQVRKYAEHHEYEFYRFISKHPGLPELPLQRVNCLTASIVQGLALHCHFIMQ